VERCGDLISISVDHGIKRPYDHIPLGGPNLSKQVRPSEPPIFEYIGRLTDNMNRQPTDHEGHRLRIWPGETFVHNLWDVMFGRDRNREMD
jgi:hypothetical protein